MPPKRTFGVTLLLWMVLILTVWGAVRVSAALRWWDVLNEFEARLSPLYLSITGAGWVAAGGVLLFGMFNRKAWARTAVFLFILLWLAEYWTERIFFESARSNLFFAAAGSALILIVVLICITHRSTQLFFTKSEAHEQPEETPNPE